MSPTQKMVGENDRAHLLPAPAFERRGAGLPQRSPEEGMERLRRVLWKTGPDTNAIGRRLFGDAWVDIVGPEKDGER